MIKIQKEHRWCSIKKVFLKIWQNSQENTVSETSFFKSCWPEACNVLKKATLTQVFSCKFCEIFKNTFFTEDIRVTASESTITLC